MKILNWLKEHKILLTLVFLGAVLRLYKLDFQSLWVDEIFSVNQGNPSNTFGQIYANLKAYDAHPPFYYFMVHIIFLCFGYTAYVLKAISAFFGILGIITMCYLGKEIDGKKTGLWSAFLCSINYFCIYYSQEGRMYTLLFFGVTVSLLTAIKYIKDVNLKTASWFCLSSLVLIYSHFYGLFFLLSIYIVFLFFILRFEKQKRVKLFGYTLLTGIITIVLYIPSLIILKQNTNRDSIWIQKPTFKTLRSIFEEFFGNSSELYTVIIIGILVTVSFVFIKIDKKKLANSKMIVSLLIVLFLCVLFPLLYSLLKLPIIVSRYLIYTLPILFLLFSISVSKIKSKYITIPLIVYISFFSAYTLFSQKKYYSTVVKTQFREGTALMESEFKDDEIVTKIGRTYLDYYLDKSNTTRIIFTMDINEYISYLINQDSKPPGFWYFDAHNPVFDLNQTSQIFLDQYYEVDNDTKLFDAFAKHYSLKTDDNNSIKINLKELFDKANFDQTGNLCIYENQTVSSNNLNLKKGNYTLILKGRSYPDIPIDGENAHLVIKLNGKILGQKYLNQDPNGEICRFPFSVITDQNTELDLVFDNDLLKGNEDRNVIINSIKIKKSE